MCDLAGDVEQDIKLAVLGSEVLVAHVPRRALSTHKHLLTGGTEHSVLQVRSHPAVGLAIHGLGSQCRRH